MINIISFLIGLFFFPVTYGLYKMIFSKRKKQMDLQDYKSMITSKDDGRSIDVVVENLKNSCQQIHFELSDKI